MSTRLRMAVLAALSSATALSASNASAGDIAFDGSLPGTTAGALNAVNGTYAITQQRGFSNGSNLFHSFDVFNLDQGETAVFSGNADISNIISRVTGGLPTTINGTVSSTIQGANFWFVNPAGLTVGPTGVIDVSGAIALGAADFINFKDGQFLASVTPGEDVTLLVANPASFGFLGDTNSGTLTIQSAQVLAQAASPNRPLVPEFPYSMVLSGGGGVLLDTTGDINLINTAIDTSPVHSGDIVLRAAGNVTLAGTDLHTDSGNTVSFGIGGISITGGGQVTLTDSLISGAGLAGVQPIEVQGSGVRLDNSVISVFSSGTSAERATIQISALGKAGDRPGAGTVTLVNSNLSTTNAGTVLTENPDFPAEIAVVGENVRLEESVISTFGRAAGGNDILVSGSQSVAIVGADKFSTLSVMTGFSAPSTGGIVVSGGAGGTELTHALIFSKSTAGVSDPANPAATVGGISILGHDGRVTISDSLVQTNAQSTIAPNGTPPDVTSDIRISGASVHIIGGQLATSVVGPPTINAPNAVDAGNISIFTTGTRDNHDGIVIEGGALIRSDALAAGANIQNGALLSVTDSGSITLVAQGGAVRISGGSQLETSAGPNAGSAGSIAISGDSIQLDGVTARTTAQSLLTGDGSEAFSPGSITLSSNGSVALDDSMLDANTSGVIQAGSISVNGSTVTIGGVTGSAISSSSTGSAAGGDISINAQDALSITSSSVSASAGANAASGGRIDVTAGSVLARDTTLDTSNASTQPVALDELGVPIGPTSDISVSATGAVGLRNTQLTTQTTGTARAGSIGVAGDSIHITGGQITASTTFDAQQSGVAETGQAGDINVIASNLDVGVTSLTIDGGALIRSNAVGSDQSTVRVGAAGEILVATLGVLNVSNARIESASRGVNAGAAGQVQLTGDTAKIDSLTANVSVESQRTELLGNGGLGAFTIGGEDVVVDNSTFTSTSSGVLNPGSIIITGQSAEANEEGSFTPRGSVVVRNSSLTATSTGIANASAAIIISTGDVKVINSSVETSSQGLAGSFGGQAVIGSGGNILIDGSSVRTSVAAQVAPAEGNDLPASLLVTGSGAVTIDNSSFQATTTGARVGGDIGIEAGQLSITDSTISAASLGTGAATQPGPLMAGATFMPGSSGSITLRLLAPTDEQVLINRSTITTNAVAANGGSLSFDANGNAVVLQESSLLASAGGGGTGGNISITNAGGLTFRDTQIQTMANAGAGGTINIGLADGVVAPILIQGSSITTNAVAASGGNITLDAAGNQLVLRDSIIRASAGAAGTGGNVLIDAVGRTIVQRSQVVARADAGNGGTIIINVDDGGLFVRDAQSFINADSNSGNDGEIAINSPDTDLNPAVKVQDAELSSTPELSATACAPRTEARSTFVRENRGGVSASPDGYLVSTGSATSQKTASTVAPEAVRLALLAATTPIMEGCR